jgi:hypothetical protein
MARDCVDIAGNDFCAKWEFGITSIDGEDQSVQVVYRYEITMRALSDAVK